MNNVHLVLLIMAFCLFVVASGFPTEPWPYRWRLVAAGLACWVASLIF